MKLLICRSLSKPERLELFDLWNKEYPERLNYKSIEEFDRYLNNLVEQSHILLLDSNKKIKGWYFDFKRDNEKWFGIVLDSKIHSKGYGTKMMTIAKQKESELNGWVIDHNRDKKYNGEQYESPLSFYLKIGFEKLTTERLESDKISAVKVRWRKKSIIDSNN